MRRPARAARCPTTRSATARTTSADGTGNCSFDASPNDLLVAAMNAPDYDNAAWCGACLEVTGPMGMVTVRVVDQCPGCAHGDLDLSPQAFQMIAPLVGGPRLDHVARGRVQRAPGRSTTTSRTARTRTGPRSRSATIAIRSRRSRRWSAARTTRSRASTTTTSSTPAGLGNGPYSAARHRHARPRRRGLRRRARRRCHAHRHRAVPRV